MNITRVGSFFDVKNKYWEVQVCNEFATDPFNFQVRYSTKGDHAGLYLSLEVFGYMFAFMILDSRHWNYDTNEWEQYDE